MFTNTTPEDIKSGKDPRNWPYDQIDRGVRYKNFYDSKKGKHLIVRWTNSPANYGVKLKFEVALYENGRIEFRYWPLGYYEPGDYSASASTATVGVFWNGTTSETSNRFRDFAPLLNYQREQRNISKLGGAPYDALYLDSTAAWSIGLDQTNWPKNGAVITFSPPQNSAKFLPRKLTSLISSNKKIIGSAGLFDDRKTIGFRNNTQIHLPSGMPTRLLGDSGDVNVSLRQLLFTSGSIEVLGNVRNSVIDSQLEQLNALESLNSFDNSFNESNVIVTTALTSSFYATGSALETFGEGFTSPLKSKTQIRFSLPVTNSTLMLASTASLYYYDSVRNSWSIPSVKNLKTNIQKMIVYASDPENGITQHPYIFRVIENSVLFDAVGRKTVSGSKNPTANGFQSSDSIGAIYNKKVAPGIGYVFGPELVPEAISKKYLKSVTDNSDFYPSQNQLITFPTDYPFLIEKMIVDIPLYISGNWFEDRTTCTKAFGTSLNGTATGYTSGAIDFGGPGLTFAMMCPKRSPNSFYMDLIASGTITSVNDNVSDVLLYKDSGMSHYFLRPIGFKSFSNPTAVVSGSGNVFEGTVRLELEASTAGGLTIVRNDRSLSGSTDVGTVIASNRRKAVDLLTSKTLFPRGESDYNTYDRSGFSSDHNEYLNRSPRIFIQQISPLSRGTSGIEFNGNSILGGTIANYSEDSFVKNPLYYSSSGSLSAELKSKIDSSEFIFESVMAYSLVDSRPAPYLMMPGDKIVISMSKTRPVIYSMSGSNNFGATDYTSFVLTGSHGTVMLNTGSINITVYGSYVKEGMEYHP
jgi:hypothetical protein